MSTTPRYARATAIALGFALLWSVLLVVAAFVAPVYSTSNSAASSDLTTGATSAAESTATATLVGVNGAGVLLIVSLPLVASLVVAAALAFGRRRLGWVVTTLLIVLNVLAMLSVGIFFVPTTLALIVACASTPRPRRRPAPDVAVLSA